MKKRKSRCENNSVLLPSSLSREIRQSEIIGLKWDDVDLEHGSITIRRQLGHQAEMRSAAGPTWNNSGKLVFTNALGEHLKHDLIYRHLKRIFAQMGILKLLLSHWTFTATSLTV